MDDLISRAAAHEMVQGLQEWCITLPGNTRITQVGYMSDAVRFGLDRLPAVDAVPVVRCSECKYAHMTYGGECKYCDFWQEDGGDALYLDKGFYCAAGERRDGDANG